MSTTAEDYFEFILPIFLPFAAMFALCQLCTKCAVRLQTEVEEIESRRRALDVAETTTQTIEKRKKEIIGSLIIHTATISELKKQFVLDADAPRREKKARGDDDEQESVTQEMLQKERLSKKKKSGTDIIAPEEDKNQFPPGGKDEEQGIYHDCHPKQQMKHDEKNTANEQGNFLFTISLGNVDKSKDQDDVASSAIQNTDMCMVLDAEKHTSYYDKGKLHDASCSICLVEYKEGDSIAWSRNSACSHAFHKECIIPWLMKHDECPICRTSYFMVNDPHMEENSDSDTAISTINPTQNAQTHNEGFPVYEYSEVLVEQQV